LLSPAGGGLFSGGGWRTARAFASVAFLAFGFPLQFAQVGWQIDLSPAFFDFQAAE